MGYLFKYSSNTPSLLLDNSSMSSSIFGADIGYDVIMSFVGEDADIIRCIGQSMLDGIFVTDVA